MALVTVRRSPAGSRHGSPTGCKDEEVSRRSQLQRRHSFVMVKGAALLLQEEEKLETVQEGPPSPDQIQSQQEQHLQLMMGLLRSEDAIRLAVRLESTRPHRIRYLLLLSTEELEGKSATVLLGVDFPEEGSARCTLGMVLPLWSDTQVFLDGDGGFSVTSGGQTRIFKPISVQTMWSVLQVLHKACNEAVHNNHFPGGSALGWAEWYQCAITSEQSCINEWLAMSDLESVRPDAPALFSDRPTQRELMERMIRAKLREIRTELEYRTSCSLKEYKEFIDNEMLLIMAQMDRPSKIFDHLYLGSEWNAANLEELQRNRISHILNVTREIDNFFPALFTYMNVRLYDEETSQLLPYWKETYHFISNVRAQNSRVLVHCKMGVSRSASTVIAYAMKEYGWTLEQAYRHVRERRPIVHPNPSFMRQLEFYQGILDASRHSSLWEQKAGDSQWEDTVEGSDTGSDQSGSEGSLCLEMLNLEEEPGLQEEEPGLQEEEPGLQEEEPVTTPQYCFRPLREPPEEPAQPQAPAGSDGPQICVQEAEEPGGSDDSGAEEVQGHLAVLRVPEPPSTPRDRRINLYAVMRSISEMDSPDAPSPLGGPAEGEVFAASGSEAPMEHPASQLASPPPSPQSQEEPGAAAPGSNAKQLPPRTSADKTGKRQGQQHSRQVPRSHAQLRKQSNHPGPGKAHMAVQQGEGLSPRTLRHARAVQHRQSVAQLMDAALVLSRTREFEERLEAAGQEMPHPGEELASSPPPPQEPPPGGGTLPPSRPRRMVRQASVDIEPGSG
ncbi:protein phosphatase Slingshot homolog 3 isoform X2 [Emydura macquarii macquarii]|uniref:protein phosphatase Slingshot homolog 3 isoform X2 n=1 Tax=Emydura macquarii macquarii TaxID=1129001 RepID=UPI00352BA59D